MSGSYLVQINTEKGRKKGKMFLVVDSGYNSIRLVKSKYAATRFGIRGLAALVSDHFWEHYWERLAKDHNLYSREVVFVKKRG